MPLQYDLVRSVYTSCAAFSFTLGMVFNAFLVWLIRTKTPAPMLVYSKLLLTPCMMDIFLCLFTFLVQPIPIVDHGYHAVVQNGFFRQVSELYNYTANVIWFQVLLLSVCATTVQFVFRYYMIFHDGHIPARLKYITGTVLSLLLFAHAMFHYLSDYPFEEYNDQMAQLAIWVHEAVGLTDIRFSSFTPARSYLWILHCLAMLIIFGICYAIIVYCARGTCNYIAKAYENAAPVGVSNNNNTEPNKNNNNNGSAGGAGRADAKKNEKMRDYNNQITTAMIVQAILPTVEVLELTIQVTLPIFVVQGGTIYFMVYAAIPLYFIPAMNPLATMLFVKPYRKAVLKMLYRQIGRRLNNSTVPVQAFQRRTGGAFPTKTALFTSKMLANRQLRTVGGGLDGTTEETSSSSTSAQIATAAADRVKQETAATAVVQPQNATNVSNNNNNNNSINDYDKELLTHQAGRHADATHTATTITTDAKTKTVRHWSADGQQRGRVENRDQLKTPDILDLTLDQLDAMNAQQTMVFGFRNRAQSDAFYYHQQQQTENRRAPISRPDDDDDGKGDDDHLAHIVAADCETRSPMSSIGE